MFLKLITEVLLIRFYFRGFIEVNKAVFVVAVARPQLQGIYDLFVQNMTLCAAIKVLEVCLLLFYLQKRTFLTVCVCVSECVLITPREAKLLDPSDSAEAAKNGNLQPVLSYACFPLNFRLKHSTPLSLSGLHGGSKHRWSSSKYSAQCFEGIDEGEPRVALVEEMDRGAPG